MERYGLVPLVLSVVATWTLVYFDISQTTPSAGVYAALAFQMIIYLPPTVAWYRALVYGEDTARRPLFTMTHLEGRLLAWQILLTMLLAAGFLIAALVVAVIGFGIRAAAGDIAAIVIVSPIALAAFAYFLMVTTRLSMTIALATLDTPVSFAIAWSMTRSVAWSLTGAIGVVSLATVLFGALAELVAWIAGAAIAMARGSDIAGVMPYVRAVAQAPTGLLWLFASATLFGFVYKSHAQSNTAPIDPPAPA